MQTYLAIGGFFTSLTTLALAIFVYRRNPANKINIVFTFMNLSFFGWGLFLGTTFLLGADSIMSVWYDRFCNMASLMGVAFYAHLMVLFAQEERRRLRDLKFIYTSAFLVSVFILIFPDYFIESIKFKLDILDFPHAGRLFLLHMLLFLTFATYGFIVLFKKYKVSQGVKKQQLGYVILASVIGFFCGISTYPLCFDIPLIPVVAPLVAFYPIILSYAIVRHRLLDIEIAMRRSFIYSCLIISIAALYASTIFLVQQLLQQKTQLSPWVGAVLAGALITISFRKLEDIFSKITDKVFFKGKYDYQKTLHRFSQDIISYTNLTDLMESVPRILIKDLRSKNASIYIQNEDKSGYAEISNTQEKDRYIPTDSVLINVMAKQKTPLVLEELERDLSLKNPLKKSDFTINEYFIKDAIQQMHTLNISVILPIITKTDLKAVLALEDKRSGDMYTETDIELLMTLANQCAIAIENINLIKEEKIISRKAFEAQAKSKYIWILKQTNEKLKNTNSELKNMQSQLVRAARFAAVGQLAAGVAHEINNPLTGVMGNIQLLKLKLRRHPNFTLGDSKDIFASIEDSARRCSVIIHGLVEFSLGAGKKKQIVDFNELTRSVYSLVGHLMEVNGIKITLDFKQTPLLVHAHPAQLQQVLFNLISNSQWAIKEKQVSSGKIEITTKIQKDGESEFACLTFKDNGIGVDLENQSTVFEPFFTTRETGKGVGLGLSIVYGIIKEHGGSIKLESMPQAGATFIVKIPLYIE